MDELRYIYVIWQEEIAPYLVVELLSEGTEDEDLGRRLWDLDKTPSKWVVYERILKIPYYLAYSRRSRQLQAFGRVSASYRPIAIPEQRLWLPEAGIGIGLWEGTYAGCEGQWLRCFDGDGQWLPTAVEARDAADARAQAEHERAEVERARAEAERTRVDGERERAERLAERLRALGIDPDDMG